MAYGSPVVATSLSAVGIKGGHKQQLLIADTAAGFANAILSLFNDSESARVMADSAYKLLVSEYSQSATGKIRNDIYKDICNIK
jgi:glycosyltransferase involved in cell wall biosynthesis